MAGVFYNIKDDHSLKVGQQGLECHIGSKQTDAQKVLLFGDSFAGHNIPFWHYLGKKTQLKYPCNYYKLVLSKYG